MSKRPAQQQTTPQKAAKTPEKLMLTPEKTPQKPKKAAASSGTPDQEKSPEKSAEMSPEESPVKDSPSKMSEAYLLALEPLPYSVVILDEAKKQKMSVPFVVPFVNLHKEVLDIKKKFGTAATTSWNLAYEKKKNSELQEKLQAQDEELKEFRAMKARAAEAVAARAAAKAAAEEAALAAAADVVFDDLEDADGPEKDAAVVEKEGALEQVEEEKEAEVEKDD
jgi:hypothetical protein